MKIIIVGAGNVGKELVSRLSEEGHDIVVVDSNEKRLNNFIDRHDVMGIAGNGADFDVLENAGVNTADLFVACTPQDELNILCSLVAKKLGAKDTVARVRSPEYFELFRERDLGLSVANYFVAYFFITVISLILISLAEPTVPAALQEADSGWFVENFSAVSTCINNVGPGLGSYGPMHNFAHMAQFSKIVLCFDMLIGRLEIVPMLLLFYPKAWTPAK